MNNARETLKDKISKTTSIGEVIKNKKKSGGVLRVQEEVIVSDGNVSIIA